MIKKVFAALTLLFGFQLAPAQSFKTQWVDSVFNTLNTNEKVGQLFIASVNANADAATIDEIMHLVNSHEIGGILFADGSIIPIPSLISSFQEKSNVPLFIAHASRLGATLDSTIVFPPPIVLGALANDTLLYRYGEVAAAKLKKAGFNMAFIPVTAAKNIDLNTFISAPSFGENTRRVTNKSLALMRGLQDNGIVTCARGFGFKTITVKSFRDDFPVLEASLDSTLMHPYSKLIANGLKGVIPGAVDVPVQYDPSVAKKKAFNGTTLTTLFSSDWLKANLDFNGLSIVEADNIENLSDKDREGDAELFAFMSGNDMIISKDIGAAMKKIKKLVRREKEYEDRLDNAVRKILGAKFDAGLWRPMEPLQNTPVLSLLLEKQLLNQKLHEGAITVLQNNHTVLPIQHLENKSFAYISSYAHEKNYAFYQYLSKYTNITFYTLEDNTDERELVKALQKHQVVIVGMFPQAVENSLQRLSKVFDQLKQKPDLIMCDFGNPDLLRYANRYPTVITAYTDSPEMYRAMPQAVFGAIPARGILPFTISDKLKEGRALPTPSLNRLAYSLPEEAKMDSRTLQRIDSIANEAIAIRATPGCQVLVARNGKVIYEKSFGYLTYNKQLPVTNETIYDVASVTKVMATLQAGMFMYEHGLMDLYKKVSAYLPELKKTNKKDITVVDMLTHQSGLVPFIPMYPQTVKDTSFLPQYYSRMRNDKYPLQVSANLYASPVLRDSAWSWIMKTKLLEKTARTPYTYKYSDLGFLILQQIAERQLNQPLDEFLHQNFYEPLGAYTTGFNPLNRFNKQSIAPTEDDKIFRRSMVSGTVHDERAAMLGGVAGHAGLFSNANDLAKVGQMLLQEGSYGGTRYFRPETVRMFTAKKFKSSRRGIGWDKPIQSDASSPTSLYASPLTFGHTGFTGTCIWIDPEFDLVYIFLSNRVYPDRSTKLINANIRSRIQDVIYKSIFNYVEQEKPSYRVNELATIKGL